MNGSEMVKKYEFTGETKVWFGRTLHRIRALIRIERYDVSVGEPGGWIEKEENLAQDGDAWVYGNAQVCGNAQVKKVEHCMVIGPIGSRNAWTTFFNNKDGRIMVTCGCFRGDVTEFLAAVEKTHGDSKHGRVYRAAVQLALEQIEPEKFEEA